MMKQGQFCVAAVYEYSRFDEYWEGTKLRTHGAIATVRRHSATPMAAVGLWDRLNLLVALPWVQTSSTEPNGGYFEGARGLQDINLALKGEIIQKQIGAGKLFLLTTAGFSTPVSNYLSDYRPYSIGFGANEFNLRGILEYRLDKGWFARGALAHLWRGQTKVERDYYYNNGSYYTPWMDVPSAWNYHGVLGKWMLNNQLRLEASYVGIRSTSGDDIRPHNAPQPTNKVSFDLVGLMAQYYPASMKGLGGLVYVSHTLDGQNTGKSTQFGAGITYLFGL